MKTSGVVFLLFFLLEATFIRNKIADIENYVFCSSLFVWKAKTILIKDKYVILVALLNQ